MSWVSSPISVATERMSAVLRAIFSLLLLIRRSPEITAIAMNKSIPRCSGQKCVKVVIVNGAFL